MKPSSILQKTGAEMVGTFALVFAGCGAIMVDELSGGQITHQIITARMKSVCDTSSR